MLKKIFLYDTTLRDGAQSEEVNFTVGDKLRIAKRLIEFGVSCIEGGWPGSNPRDIEFFKSLKKHSIPKYKISAFASTRRAKGKIEKDSIITALLEADVPNLTVFGKSWDMHVTKALGISLEENLEMIGETVSYLKARAQTVYFDAEHFFDGYKNNKKYAMKAIQTAYNAGADAVILCETNGGTMTEEVRQITSAVRKHFTSDKVLGIHCHNDCELAVANSLAAVSAGASHVQGTINGIGERCGNANLCSIIANLQLKLGYDCVGERLKELREVAMFVNELGNLSANIRAPYVGRSAFAHKGGIHVSGVMKNSATYEHIAPELVGNYQRVLVSDLSGKSNLLYKARSYGYELSDAAAAKLLDKMKHLENRGYEYEGAEASFELLLLQAMGDWKGFFDLVSYRVIDDKRSEGDIPFSEATVCLSVNGVIEHTAAMGNGPVNALDNAVRKALITFYPTLSHMKLVDYKVRILDSTSGTEALTRVLMESSDGENNWSTVGVAANIVDASYQALVDAVQYKLYKEYVRKRDPFI